MERKQKKVQIALKIYTLKNLFPADFLSEKFWPFSFYRLPEDIKKAEKGPEIEWKLKPKALTDHEEALKSTIARALDIGAGVREILDETIKLILLSEIYALTYGLTISQKILCPFEIISREQAEMFFIKAKAYNCEPYALIANLFTEIPELYNPRRYDFNLFVLGCGWERERREIEKAQRDMNARTAPMRKR